jgi:hypothetical protein
VKEREGGERSVDDARREKETVEERKLEKKEEGKKNLTERREKK